MNKNIATTIEQSQRLIAAGVDPNTADMEWVDTGILDTQILSVGQFVADATPAWSLSALLEMLPSSIDIDEDEYSPIVTYDLIIFPAKGWVVEYIECQEESGFLLEKTEDASLVEAAVRMIEILSSKHIKFSRYEKR